MSNESNQFVGNSRGYKTKGNSYKHRYVEKICPECGHNKAYKDEWRTRNSYKCMKRSCRHNWFIAIDPKTKEELA
ncbi:hypothetical protein KLEB273_gp109 [Bacillus phage vB_BauM_KLEB27-3]|nr:hypothetical protein KLEB273_gp109 [Bacillus phage vB_BauM_KLEB27-3]